MRSAEQQAPPAKPQVTEPPAPPPQAGATGPVQPEGEIDGPKGPEPTRYGDWEKGGRVSDF